MESVHILVVAAGAIVDARGFLAALVLGADGICMGTRFLAAAESPVHNNVKTAILNADENSAVVWGRGWNIARGLKNSFTEEVLRGEKEGLDSKALKAFVNSYQENVHDVNRRIGGLIHGDIERGEIYLGEGAALIRKIMTVEEIIQELVGDTSGILETCRQKVNFAGV